MLPPALFAFITNDNVKQMKSDIHGYFSGHISGHPAESLASPQNREMGQEIHKTDPTRPLSAAGGRRAPQLNEALWAMKQGHQG